MPTGSGTEGRPKGWRIPRKRPVAEELTASHARDRPPPRASNASSGGGGNATSFAIRRQGKATETFPDGTKVTYQISKPDGLRQGEATETFPDGITVDFTYVDSVRHGPAKLTSCAEDGTVEFIIAWTYVNGVSRGKATDTSFTGEGSTIDFIYVDGEMQGKAVETFADGRTIEFDYVDGVREGDAVETLPDGRVVRLSYADGKRMDASEGQQPDDAAATGAEGSDEEGAAGGSGGIATAPSNDDDEATSNNAPIYKVKKIPMGKNRYKYTGLAKCGRKWEQLEYRWAVENFGKAFVGSLAMGVPRMVPQGASSATSSRTEASGVAAAGSSSSQESARAHADRIIKGRCDNKATAANSMSPGGSSASAAPMSAPPPPPAVGKAPAPSGGTTHPWSSAGAQHPYRTRPPPKVRCQGGQDHCVAYGLSGALRYSGFDEIAAALERSAHEITTVTDSQAVATVDLVTRLGCWSSTPRLRRFDPLTDRSPYPTIAQICDSEGEARHVIGIAGDWLFDSNRFEALPLSREALDSACPGDSHFSHVSYAVRFVPNKKRRLYLLEKVATLDAGRDCAPVASSLPGQGVYF